MPIRRQGQRQSKVLETQVSLASVWLSLIIFRHRVFNILILVQDMLKEVTRKVLLEESKGNLHISMRDKAPHRNRV